MSSIIANFGITGNGKTYRSLMFVEKYKEKKPYVVDPGFQYIEYPHLTQIDPFIDIKIPLQRILNGIIIVDEAQLEFVHANSNKPMVRAMSMCRHNKTVTVLNFHALNQFPVYLMNYVNQLVIGHTNDRMDEYKRWGGNILSQKVKRAMEALEPVRGIIDDAAELVINI